MTVGAPKAVGDGHSMGETGLKAAGECLHYVMGSKTMGIPTLRRLDPDLGPAAEAFLLQSDPVQGQTDGGALTSTQGFGGYDGAMAFRAANPDSLNRYQFDDSRLLDAYLERWTDIRSARIANERKARWRRGATLALAERHGWPGV